MQNKCPFDTPRTRLSHTMILVNDIEHAKDRGPIANFCSVLFYDTQ